MNYVSYKKNLTLICLLLLFVLPFASAWYIYHSPQVHQLAKKNHGTLLDPVHNLNVQNWHETDTQNNLDAAPFRGKWGILLITYPSCYHSNHQANALVEKRWIELDKVKVSLGKDQSRVALVQAFPGLNTTLGQKEGEVYLFDPLGNLILSYTPDESNRDIRQDLKQLLRASQIG
jgi:hypothetical protein